jgi:hypothetical protein
MSKQRYVDTKFWTDGYINDLDPIEKLLFLYLLTNERTNVAGIYELPTKVMAVETGIEWSMVDKVIGRFQADGKVVRHESWIKLVNYQKYQATDNPKIMTGVKRVIQAIPSYVMDSLSRPIDSPSRPMEEPSRDSNNFNLYSNLDLDSTTDLVSTTMLPGTTNKVRKSTTDVVARPRLAVPISMKCLATGNA